MSSVFFHLKSVLERVAGRKPRMKYFTSLKEADAHRRMHPDERQVVCLNDRIIKRQSCALARCEFEKTRRAISLGEKTGLFKVPAILDFDEPAGSISLARLRGYTPLKQILRESKSHDELMEVVARALAAVHAHLRLPPDMVVPPPEPLCCPALHVFLHGDFNTTNLGFAGDDKKLVIFDWSASDQYGGQATVGPYLLELAWFIMGLLRRRSVGWGPLQVYGFGELADADELAASFINHYLHAAGRGLDAVLLNDYFRLVYEYVLCRNAPLRRGINAASEQRRLHRRLLRLVDGQFGASSAVGGQDGQNQ